ncbi:MAG: MFS transporter [Pseudomonadota bacterium]
MQRSLAVLFLAQLISVTGSVSVVQIGGLVGLEIAPRDDLATLPLSLMVIGTAIGTLGAAALMQRIGRRLGFAVGAAIGATAMLCAGIALQAGEFVPFCAAVALFGISLAFTQQFRFAAAECVDTARAPVAIGWVLFGSIGGALLGPRLIHWLAAEPISATASAVFTSLAGLLGASMLLFLLFFTAPRSHIDASGSSWRSNTQSLWSRPGFLLAVVAGATSYGVMTLVMTATPISMHAHQGHSMTVTGWVIASHVVAMYLPSLFTGAILTRWGCREVMLAGTVALGSSLIVGLAGQSVGHYWASLVLLGLGWNFLFVGATTLLTRTYNVAERFKAQAINDFCVFGASALASLLAGGVLHYVGWTWLLVIPLPLLAVVILALIRNDSAPFAVPASPRGS